MRIRLGLLFVALAISTYLFFTPSIPKKEEFVSSLPSMTHPTERDYEKIQRYLREGLRPELALMGDFEPRVRAFKLFDKHHKIESGRVCVNTGEEDKESCILLYASFNKNYPQALYSLLQKIQSSDFKGHILYYVGGFPNAEEGDLSLVLSPYAFKIALFREAKRLGYKRALWLDSSIEPLTSLNDSFDWIAQKGFLAVGNTHMIGPFFNEKAAAALHVTMQESFLIPSVSASILGFDLSSPLCIQALQEWYLAALDPDAFFSPRSEQTALSIILYKLGMTDWIPFEKVAEDKSQITAASLYFLNRPLAHHIKKKKKR